MNLVDELIEIAQRQAKNNNLWRKTTKDYHYDTYIRFSDTKELNYVEIWCPKEPSEWLTFSWKYSEEFKGGTEKYSDTGYVAFKRHGDNQLQIRKGAYHNRKSLINPNGNVAFLQTWKLLKSTLGLKELNNDIVMIGY